jgi:RimJ/RimL family protein N-acetyltransferase
MKVILETDRLLLREYVEEDAEAGLKRIIGLVMPETIASVRVLEKAGLRYAGSVSF